MSTQEWRKQKVLMVVKTYPTPSSSYGELVCTAGIRLDTMEWIRIYPYPFRQAKEGEQFEKYDIIEAPIERETKDPRKDSFRLYDMSAIKKIDHLKVDKYWSKRMPYIRKTAAESVSALMTGMLSEDKSIWGPSILPVQVEPSSGKFSWEFKGGEWSEADLQKLQSVNNKSQLGLFDNDEAKKYFQVLRRLPYTFRLHFRDLTGEEYKFPILDWEIAQLYFKVRFKVNSDEEALEKVRQKIEDQIFAAKRDVFLVLGNIHHRFKRRDSLAIDGFIWPERQLQSSLFGDEDV